MPGVKLGVCYQERRKRQIVGNQKSAIGKKSKSCGQNMFDIYFEKPSQDIKLSSMRTTGLNSYYSHDAIYIWCTIELYIWDIYNFINYHPPINLINK